MSNKTKPLFYWRTTNHSVGFRVFGYGAIIKDTTHQDYSPIFSERNLIGCSIIGKYIIRWLY